MVSLEQVSPPAALELALHLPPTSLSSSNSSSRGRGASQYHTLVTKDNKPIARSTAWDGIQPQGQSYLLEIECAPAPHLWRD